MMNNLSPKAIGVCSLIFIISALFTLSTRFSNSEDQSLPSRLHDLLPLREHTQQPALGRASVAFATFLSGNPELKDDEPDDADGYFLGARVLAYSLLHSPDSASQSPVPFIVLCTEDVSPSKRDRLTKEGATIYVAPKLNTTMEIGTPRWRDVLQKLRLFQLTRYTKICFIDADALVTKPLDGVFYDEATLQQDVLDNDEFIKEDEAPLPRKYMFASKPDAWGYDHAYPPDHPEQDYLNCGFFVFTPDEGLFRYYVSLLSLTGRFDPTFPEQNLFNYAHRAEGNMPWKHLWHGWNMNWPTKKDYDGGAASFHAKYWNDDPTHDVFLKRLWWNKRWEMEGFHQGKDAVLARV